MWTVAGIIRRRRGGIVSRLITEAGHVRLDVPRDRAGTFEPRIVRKGQRRLDGVDRLVISLYARGMTVRDIQAHLLEIYEVEVSPDLISRITDAVLEEVNDWQAAHLAVGIDVDGRKEVSVTGNLGVRFGCLTGAGWTQTCRVGR